jgi:hypothetical protein
MLKAGVPATDAAVQAIVAGVEKKFSTGAYKPSVPQYESGVDLMFLAEADPTRYRDRIAEIAQFIIAQQDASGFWDYPPPERRAGDTSITQYGLLGLWSAAHSGVDVPADVWERAGRWVIRTQNPNGSFQYRPGTSPHTTHGLTAAGAGSLEIIAVNLFPGGKPKAQPAAEVPKFGVLEKVQLDQEKKPPSGAVTIRIDELRAAEAKGVGWLTANFRITKVDGLPMYYLYALERVASLAAIERVGSHDWYAEGLSYLTSTQLADGSWKSDSAAEREIAATSFAVLFIMRATKQMVGKPPEPVGSGLLAGGRGLPTDLSAVQVRGGEIVKKEVTGPLDDLLAQLGTPQSAPIEAVQEAIVQKVQLGDRESLVGQKERLKTLVDHPDAEIRRTVLWALGRSGDLDVAGMLIEALDDPNVDVVMEARNALCFVSRQPLGFGEPESPLEAIPETATEDQQQEAIRKWQADVRRKWTQWYLRVRPYAERDDLLDAANTGAK